MLFDQNFQLLHILLTRIDVMSIAYISAIIPMSGSSHEDKIILLTGVMSVVTLLVVVVVVSIGGAIIIKIKKQKSKTRRSI